ncbi:MAG: PfkB family carbohydrate kinase [Chloroflexota bacterium]
MKIVSVGEITIDRYLNQNLSFVGGIGLNFAVQAKRGGAESASMVSCVGDGPLGTWVLETLEKEEVDTTNLAVLAGKTAEIDIEVNDDGERFFPPCGYRANVLNQFHLTEAAKHFICQHDLVTTQYDGEAADSLAMQLIELPTNTIKRVLDFGDWSAGRQKALSPATLNSIDLAFFSGDEETVKRLEPLAEQSNCLIVVTLGAAGSLALIPSGSIFQPALDVEQIVDTTGCGDAFQAAFSLSYFLNGAVPMALRRGAEQAAQVLQHFGAFSQEPR